MGDLAGRERLWSIGEAARMAGLSVKTVRYYAEVGLVEPAAVSEAGYRLYGAAEVWRLGLVRGLRRLGFSLREVRGILGGGTSVEEAIRVQRAAVRARLGHLRRLEAILDAAAESVGACPDPEESVQYLREIGEAMSMEERERQQFLVERLQAAILGEEAPEDWREEFLRSMQIELPQEFTPEQAVAWNELVALLNDPEFIAAHRSDSAPMWEVLEQRGIEIRWWNRSMREVSERGRTAIRCGESPGSEAAQEIVDDWVALFATVMGQEPTPEFTRNFARMAPAWIEREGQKQRLWELLETLDESGNIAEHQKSERFLVAGLLEKVEREA